MAVTRDQIGKGPARLGVLLLAIVVLTGVECGAEAATTVAPPPVPAPVVAITAGRFTLFPGDDLYPQYIADPRRTGFGAQRMLHVRQEIPASGGDRLLLKASGTFGIVRARTEATSDSVWQLSAVGGVDGLFDAENSLDNIGWDGIYGLLATGRPLSDVAVKVGVLHNSSHLGDEYIERTGRQRLGYTREELVGGISWLPSYSWRLYGEVGWGSGLSNRQLMEPWRLQGGVEYAPPASLWQHRLGWYGAADVTVMEERDWRPDTTVQAGLVARSYGNNWRLGVEYHHGPPRLGEFFQETESYLSAGIWLDL